MSLAKCSTHKDTVCIRTTAVLIGVERDSQRKKRPQGSCSGTQNLNVVPVANSRSVDILTLEPRALGCPPNSRIQYFRGA